MLQCIQFEVQKGGVSRRGYLYKDHSDNGVFPLAMDIDAPMQRVREGRALVAWRYLIPVPRPTSLTFLR